MVKVSAVVLASLLAVSCAGKREKQLSKNLEALQIADLKPKELKVTSFDTRGKNEALLEADVHTAFLMRKNSRGEWEIQSLRVGDRRWEDAKLLSAALNQLKQAQVKNDFEKLAAAVEKFKAKTQSLPSAQNIAELNDVLYPAYLPGILRVDPWSTEYDFHLNSKDSYTIVSAGPDRKFGTADDMRFEH